MMMRFDDLLAYIEESPHMEYKAESRNTGADGSTEQFVQLQVSTEIFKTEIDSVIQREEELMQKFKESKAYEELMKNIEADSTGNE